MAPVSIRGHVESLGKVSQQPYYGSRHDRKTKRSDARREFIDAARGDLHVD